MGKAFTGYGVGETRLTTPTGMRMSRRVQEA